MADDNDFLGRGWAFPPTFNKGSQGVAMVDGEEDIRQSLTILLNTQLGDRCMHPAFGLDSRSWLFSDVPSARIKLMIEDAIFEYEPRVLLQSVDVETIPVEGKIVVQIEYVVKATNSRYNLVFPYYLND